MKSIIQPIQLKESSLRVSLLHKILSRLGHPVSKKEEASRTAGESTRKSVRELAEKLKIKHNEAYVADADMYAALVSGFANEKAFSVRGTVYRRSGMIVKRQRLIALDVDLRGAAVYRTVKTLAELEQNGGFDFIAETISDAKGAYIVEFYDWQFANAERKKADVVVYALDEKGNITGRSRMVNSEDYADTQEVTGLDILLANAEEKTEYENLMNELVPFLDENKIQLQELSTSVDQIQFVSSELDEPRHRVQIAVEAELLRNGRDGLAHEILYGIGRQQIKLNWPVLYQTSDEQLQSAITKSVAENIIRAQEPEAIASFLKLLQSQGAAVGVDGSLEKILVTVLPEKAQQQAFVTALRNFKNAGSDDYAKFWNEHLPAETIFKDNPALIKALLLNQQLLLISGSHLPLVTELQLTRKISDVTELLDLDEKGWKSIIDKTGIPSFIKGDNDAVRAQNYTALLQNTLNAAYPTQKIAAMVKNEELSIKDQAVRTGISNFLQQNAGFDFSSSRIQEFEKEIKAVAQENYEILNGELKRIQRVFQVSTSPAAMAVLMQNNLNSAYSIASIPAKSFAKMYGGPLGGEQHAHAIHQRSTYLNTLATERAMKLHDVGYADAPLYAFSEEDYVEAMSVLQKNVPNYAQLFGSPSLCECEHCRSVYSAAAYFVDLLRFLWRGAVNDDNKTPLDMFRERRPDLLHLPLTCENTNTIIPYIDLVNEIMEYYTVHGSIDSAAVHDTGDASADELRANPQYFEPEAYRILKNAVYPFSLPYHQPLDVIRTYSDHLKTARYDVMKGMQKDFSPQAVKAISAEALRISEEEFRVLTTKKFDGTDDVDELSAIMPKPARQLHQYFGYAAAGQMEKMAGTGVSDGIHEFLRRSGLKYTDLVELVKTTFINPHQQLLDFLEALFVNSTMNASTIYTKLQQVNAGTLNPATDAGIMAVLTAASMQPADFTAWVQNNFDEFNSIITLYQSTSTCHLDTTYLRKVVNVYSGTNASGITSNEWSRIHRFIRLWRKLGWKINEVDLMLAALGETDITDQTISKLSAAVRLNKQLKLPVNKLAVLWGNIDKYGNKSLYKKLFLNKAVQKIDTAFEADSFGNYLTDGTQVLADHIPAILSAFRISEDELAAILAHALVTDAGGSRLINPATDTLNIFNLSVIYRYTVLAKSLKLKMADLALLLQLFNSKPFSTLNVVASAYTDISPEATLEFYELAAAVKNAGFKPATLQYIFSGALSPESTIGLDAATARQAAHDIAVSFTAIEQEHPDDPPAPLTADIIRAKLSLTFQPDVVSRFMSIADGTAAFTVVTEPNLAVTIPAPLAAKYNYIKASGRLNATGIMTDAESAALKALPGANANFVNAVDAIYQQPEDFIKTNFADVFQPMNAALTTLLDHPAQATPATIEEKFKLVYQSYLPLLKQKLHKDAITQHIAALVGSTGEVAAILAGNDMQPLIDSLSMKGFSAEYFSDNTFTTSVLTRTDGAIDFDWGTGTPDPLVPAGNFSVRWQAYLSAPSSGDYTFIVTVKEADEAFRLYLDGALILEKPAGNAMLSWETLAPLNAAQMHRLVVEYAQTSGQSGIFISWKTATSAVEIIPSSTMLPAREVDSFAANASVYHRAGKFIAGFKLTAKEVNHFINFSSDFDNINFKALTPMHWRRVNDYVELRNAVPQTQALLTDVFAVANMVNPAPTTAALRDLLHLATAWEINTIDYLINTYFILTPADFRNEIALNKIYKAVQFVLKTGLSAQTLAEWAAPVTDFDALNVTASLVKSTVKAKYEEEDWLKLAGDLSNKIRENQKQALISYLLTRQELMNWGVVDADGLFEYFLIDVQMGACMDTSRIVQANAAIQMFVNRCLLNLESDKTTGNETGVAPDYIDKDRWEWMKNYRVWEVNRKIFLYPENWLEPEWRDDRSAFFKDLESELVQNDITDRSVENAFRNYLSKLNLVSNLDVCGTYQENDANGDLALLHVFARTHTAPYQFFYRTWNAYRKWSAWDKVPVDIRVVENGNNSGVHLVPVVWKNRLFIFWPEFIEKELPKDLGAGTTVEACAKKTPGELMSSRYYEIRLAWSEYIENKWAPKQLTKEFLVIYSDDPVREYTLRPFIDSTNQSLYITIRNYVDEQMCTFVLSDIQSPVIADQTSIYGDPYATQAYANNFMKRYRDSKLIFNGKNYLKEKQHHNILYSPQWMDFETSLSYPFFYNDSYRTYFVRPVTIRVLQHIKQPAKFPPYYHDLDMRKTVPDFIDQQQYLPGYGLGDPSPEGYINTGHTRRVNNIYPGTVVLMDTVMQPFSGAAGSQMMMAKSKTFSPMTSTSLKDTVYLQEAFGGVSLGKSAGNYKYTSKKALEFQTFYHPFSTQFVTNLNAGGVKGLLGSDTMLNASNKPLYNDGGSTFVDNYDPNFQESYVLKAPSTSDFDAGKAYTYYKENVCFDFFGANSIYNWELFFHVPMYIATRLSRNGKYEEAMKWFHYIFDPTTDEMPLADQTVTSRYWKVLPFKTTPAKNLEEWFKSLGANNDPTAEEASIGEWRDDPFKPFLVARNRPLAFMKNVVIKYVENLRLWGDSLFRQFTRESVNEALQLYVIASHILGPRPQFVPKRGKIKAETYASLENKWDDFSNALVEMENIFPYSSAVPVSDAGDSPALLGIGPALYFCIPGNEKLLEHWDTVSDRLYKIRHCMDIDGVKRQLALFSPPIDPAMLINAAAQGLSLGSILADLGSPPPNYRFSFLVQKANDFCNEVKSLGSLLLSVLEKKDAEELSRLRATHETSMLELMEAVKQRQVLDARANKEALLKARDSMAMRLQHFNALLSTEAVTIPAAPTIDANLTVDSQLPADTSIAAVVSDVDATLEDGGATGVKLISKEKGDLDLSEAAKWTTSISAFAEGIAAVLHLIPQFEADGKPLGVGAGVGFGGVQVGGIATGLARAGHSVGGYLSMQAASAQKMAGYIRREQDWALQANIAAKEIIQLDKQITSADIKIQVAEKELAAHQVQIQNAKDTEQYLKDKFTNQELYQWMKEQLFTVYKQSYNLAYDMARKVEKCYQFEIGNEITNFIQYGYWDNTQQGLCSGEKLQLALRRLEKAYIEDNKREFELTKSVSVALANPLALQELRTTGKCFVTVPEELFDMDYQGHYFRRIKSVSISLPCIAGPYTTISCTLRLLKNSIRINTSMNDEGFYEHNHDEGVLIDDDRFRESNIPVKAIAASTGQKDSGLFELSFRDDRYLPFEGAGAISQWKIELTQENDLRQFDYSTISDVILHINYTAREDAGLADDVVTYLKKFLSNIDELTTQPLVRMFSMKHEFSTEFHKFLYPAVSGADQVLTLLLQKDHFPYFAKFRNIDVKKIEVLVKANREGDYKLVFTAMDTDDAAMNSDEISMPESSTYGNMQKATLAGTVAGVDVETINVLAPMTFKFRHSTDPVAAPQRYNFIDTDPEEINDLFVVLHYSLSDVV